jgi:spore maturation protein CgeB
MSHRLQIRMFAHSWVSDWNHGNAHFLRGLARELMEQGHGVRCYEELGSWSLSNLVRLEGEAAIESIDQFRRTFPELDVRFYRRGSELRDVLKQEMRGADVVLIHEWNEPEVVNTLLDLKQQLGFRALFHDTHHRAYTNPRDILRFNLHLLDGVLAFGEAMRRIYADGFGVPRVWTFHEAADVRSFYPLTRPKSIDILWIGNWGDDERTQELAEYLSGPAAGLQHRKTVVHGVRYPEYALQKLEEAGIEFRGYLPNLRAPELYSESGITIHIPRRQYANGLSGIPTIRMFEALACGVALVCSPWSDDEKLFRPGEDYLTAADGRDMQAEIERLLKDDAARRQMAERGLQTILQRHTCAHRAQQLTEICEELER